MSAPFFWSELVVYGSIEDLTQWKEAHLLETSPGSVILNFNASVPMPAELYDTWEPRMTRSLSLKRLYGADGWLEWRLQNWGVSTEGMEARIVQSGPTWFKVEFKTFGGPPDRWLERVMSGSPSMSFAMSPK